MVFCWSLIFFFLMDRILSSTCEGALTRPVLMFFLLVCLICVILTNPTLTLSIHLSDFLMRLLSPAIFFDSHLSRFPLISDYFRALFALPRGQLASLSVSQSLSIISHLSLSSLSLSDLSSLSLVLMHSCFCHLFQVLPLFLDSFSSLSSY